MILQPVTSWYYQEEPIPPPPKGGRPLGLFLWHRLESGAQFQLEQLITWHALHRHMPPLDRPRHVLDAGGGPGRYTLALAAQGYTVTLLDLSPELLALAKQRIATSDTAVQRRVAAVIEGSITDLSCFDAAYFDAVLCLGGPLSHVIEATQRSRALAELRRVAAPGAPVCVSVMNRLGAYRSVVQWPNCYGQFLPHLPATGVTAIGAGAPTYYFLPAEFVESLETAGLVLERLYGCQGLGAHLQEDHLATLMADAARWPTWHELLLATCDEPSVVGVFNHLLAVCTPTAEPAATLRP